MSPRITHSKVSGKPNPTDASKVGGEDWDADHVIDGLTIGTDVQAHDTTLDALAGLTTAANKLPYFTNVDVAAVTDLSAFGRSLIDDADADTARTTIGLLSVPREVLTANRTYYVRTDGNNSNNGLANTSGGAFLTIQKAVDVVMALDLNGYTVTISVSDGTYTSGVFLGALTGRGNGGVDIVGNTTTPANCFISVTGANAFLVRGSGWSARGFKTATTTAGAHILVQVNAVFNMYEWDFGVAASGYSHMSTDTGGTVNFNSNYTISGGAFAHWQADLGGSVVRGAVTTVTLSGTPAFASAFAFAWRGSKVHCPNQTFSGSATGLRYTVGSLGQILTFGGGASYLPGNSAGYVDTATYGVYS